MATDERVAVAGVRVRPIPEGYHAVTPHLTVPGIARLIEFLGRAFGATEIDRFAGPDGSIMHAQVRIGDSIVMMGEPGGEFKAMPAVLHLYVSDVDATYRRAIEAGGKSLREPADQFYGDRSGGVLDPSGNQWWISTHIEDVSPEEMQRRMQTR
jgi:PhnB protein